MDMKMSVVDTKTLACMIRDAVLEGPSQAKEAVKERARGTEILLTDESFHESALIALELLLKERSPHTYVEALMAAFGLDEADELKAVHKVYADYMEKLGPYLRFVRDGERTVEKRSV